VKARSSPRSGPASAPARENAPAKPGGTKPAPSTAPVDLLARARLLGHGPEVPAVQRLLGQGDEHTEGDVTYVSDAHDRVTRAYGRVYALAPAETGRGEAQMRTTATIGALYKKIFTYNEKRNAFDGGHIVAHGRGGASGMQNMVPMEKDYNESGSYKIFESSVIQTLTSAKLHDNQDYLHIDMRVQYPDEGVDNVLGGLVAKDTRGLVGKIQNDPEASFLVNSAFRRLPTAIACHELKSPLTGKDYTGHVTQPTNPRVPLKRNTRHNASVNSIKSVGPESRTHIYGEGKPLKSQVAPDFEAFREHKILYQDQQPAGITTFHTSGTGLAGGVDAYIWIDLLGTQDKFGGTGTSASVAPLGTDWPLLERARTPGTILDPGAKSPYIKGHLLNSQLHGPGHDSRNLVPLTRYANKIMSGDFEEKVKEHAAVTDPTRGVFWEARTQGVVQRPGGWDQQEAKKNFSENLFNEEAKLPATVKLEAWEGQIGQDKKPVKGNQFLSVTVPNVLDAGTAQLGVTLSQSHNLRQHDAPSHPNTLAPLQHQGYRTRTHTALQVQPPLLLQPPPQQVQQVQPPSQEEVGRRLQRDWIEREYRIGVDVARSGRKLYSGSSNYKWDGFQDWWAGYEDRLRHRRPAFDSWGYLDGFHDAAEEMEHGFYDGERGDPPAYRPEEAPAYAEGFQDGHRMFARREYEYGAELASRGGMPEQNATRYVLDGWADFRSGRDAGYRYERPTSHAPAYQRGYDVGRDKRNAEEYSYGVDRARRRLGLPDDVPFAFRRGFMDYRNGFRDGWRGAERGFGGRGYDLGYQDGFWRRRKSSFQKKKKDNWRRPPGDSGSGGGRLEKRADKNNFKQRRFGQSKY